MNHNVKKIASPLLYRLTDHEPENVFDLVEQRYISFTQLQDDIRNNLEQLLNVRLLDSEATQFNTELTRSVLQYGLHDFTHYYALIKTQSKEFCQRIKQTIDHFEPRLQQVTVSLSEDNEKNSRILTIRINGVIAIRAAAKHASFESNLDIVHDKFTFKDEL